MKHISGKDLNLGFALAVLFSITLVAGAYKWPFFVVSATFLVSYIMLDRKKLRCPNCGGFENLNRLMSAKKHVFHCRHCGERINVI